MIAAALLQRHLREVHDCTCPDALIETFAMTMPQIHERQRQCYRPDEARKRMTDFVLMSKRISISITRETRVMTEEKSAISKMSTTERGGAPEISELRSDKKRSRKVAQNSGRSSALGKRPRLGLIKIETCNWRLRTEHHHDYPMYVSNAVNIIHLFLLLLVEMLSFTFWM